ncbi:uncharacterized protein RCC_03745 [Ramularia collo-cygni]|uniref:Extracellular membrane protein CFEM domain-containing protein n=1 Tax=Ramularia collo-cygni TaxID=112498 RepID=A0A2D3USS4_9PEZI|nr:uncharacterized protein RCC_03745 [Ramularia collo-cygni]CZT17908.1 uncharacterized protein RCC_03745 [Ramularia collo-cygni]
MQLTNVIALLSVLGATALAAPQVDAGCTLSCGIWNGCRVRNAITGDPLTECGAEPPRCNCTQFANSAKEALDQKM